MSVLPLTTLPTPTLHDPSAPVPKAFLLSPEGRQFEQDLIDTMYHAKGIGIAAAQVGKNVQMCIIGKEALVPEQMTITQGHIDMKKDLLLVNPTLERITRKSMSDQEGCLSVPGLYGTVKRFKDVRVHALDREGNPLVFEASHFLARVVAHELDHLNGTIFIDRAKDVYEVELEHNEK